MAFVKRCFLGSLVVAALMADSVAARDLCVTANQAKAMELRFIQTHLMVATLKCRGREGSTIEVTYNQYMRKSAAERKAATPHLKAGVRRLRLRSVDKYIVSLANEISTASSKVRDFCARSEEAMVTAAPFGYEADCFKACLADQVPDTG